MKSAHASTITAGIDVSKGTLDIGFENNQATLSLPATPRRHADVIAFLRHWNTQRVGLESTGVYSMELRDTLVEAGFEVVLLQPMQVIAHRKIVLKRAKTDAIDAALIAQVTAMVGPRLNFIDPSLNPFRGAIADG